MNVTPSEVRTYSMYGLVGFGLLMLPTTVVLFVLAGLVESWALMTVGIVTAVAGAVAIGVSYDELKKATHESNAEKELLTREQQKRLRAQRGDVLFDGAMVDVEKRRMQVEAEREALLHRQLEASDGVKRPEPFDTPNESRRTPHDHDYGNHYDRY